VKALSFEQVRIFDGADGSEIIEIQMIRAKGAADRDNTFYICEAVAVRVVKNYMGMTIKQTGTFWRYSVFIGAKWVLSDKPVGVHKLAQCGQLIAQYLELENPQLYTGHCFKRSGGTIMAEGNATPFQIQNRMGMY
jgi:hypothetical protein